MAESGSDRTGPALVTGSTVAVFGMSEAGHFQRLRPLIAGLSERGADVHVLTDRRFEADVVRSGGTFVDLFERYPLDDADDESLPVPCRYVSFAGRYAEDVGRDLARLRPSLMIYDTFAVIGRVVARSLDLPYVNVCAGHGMVPTSVEALVANHPRVAISDRCREAVETLRDRHGIEDASPFSYLTGLSPLLNVYCEPSPFLTASERRAFDPVAFFGSLPPAGEIAAREQHSGPSPFEAGANALKVYVCFGTVVWRYWPGEALDALRAISGALATRDDVRAVISLGGVEIGAAEERSLAARNVEVARQVDQWHVLSETDVFITHQGLNSTHEAIYNLVPMVSYPFFTDQPALAERCRELGLAVPLTQAPREPVTQQAVDAALAKVADSAASMHASLERAREWEREVIADRASILGRITALGLE
jgi:MGT family glycosyltransferase